MKILEINNLSKSYKNKVILNNINLSINKGVIVGLLGNNGCGKTTLIKVINKVAQKDSGTILINNLPLGIETKKIVSYLPDTTYLNENMKITKVIDYFNNFYDDFDVQKVHQMLVRFNIDLNTKLNQLSKGNKEKVQLALVIARNASLYILDEPIAGVDSATRSYIIKVILEFINEDASVIIATHLINDIENILDEVIFMKDGSILFHKEADVLREEKQMSIDALFKEVYAC